MCHFFLNFSYLNVKCHTFSDEFSSAQGLSLSKIQKSVVYCLFKLGGIAGFFGFKYHKIHQNIVPGGDCHHTNYLCYRARDYKRHRPSHHRRQLRINQAKRNKLPDLCFSHLLRVLKHHKFIEHKARHEPDQKTNRRRHIDVRPW